MVTLSIFQKINQRLEQIKDIHFTPKEIEGETLAESFGVDEDTFKFVTDTAELLFKSSPTLKDHLENLVSLLSEGFDPYVVIMMAFHSGALYGIKVVTQYKEKEE